MKYLLNDYPLIILPSLASRIGLNETIILQQLHYWLQRSKNEREGRYWVYNSYKEWQNQFPWWSEKTIARTLKYLEDTGLIESSTKFNTGLNKTKWYTINYDNMNDLIDQMEPQTDAAVIETGDLFKKKPKKEKEGIPPEAVELAKRLYQSIKADIPNFHEPNITTWAKVFNLMNKKDKLVWETIEEVMNWARNDKKPRQGSSFCWAPNILSPQKLRQKFFTLQSQMSRGPNHNAVKDFQQRKTTGTTI